MSNCMRHCGHYPCTFRGGAGAFGAPGCCTRLDKMRGEGEMIFSFSLEAPRHVKQRARHPKTMARAACRVASNIARGLSACHLRRDRRAQRMDIHTVLDKSLELGLGSTAFERTRLCGSRCHSMCDLPLPALSWYPRPRSPPGALLTARCRASGMIERKIKRVWPGVGPVFSQPPSLTITPYTPITQPPLPHTTMQLAGRASVLLLAAVLLAPEAAQAFTIRQPMKMAATATKAGATSADQKVEEPLLLRAARGEVRLEGGREGWS